MTAIASRMFGVVPPVTTYTPSPNDVTTVVRLTSVSSRGGGGAARGGTSSTWKSLVSSSPKCFSSISVARRLAHPHFWRVRS